MKVQNSNPPKERKPSNLHRGYENDAYPLAALTRPLPSTFGLQAFITAARLGSINKAAQHLCRTQGAISRQIQQLEEYYQHALFSRHAKGLELTREGAVLLQVASQLLMMLVHHGDVLAGFESTLMLRLPSTFAVRWFLPRSERINQAMQDTSLQISTAAYQAPDFSDPNLDAIVVRGKGNWPGLECIELFPEQLTPLCTADIAASLHDTDDLIHQTLLHPGESRDQWRCWLQATGATSQIDIQQGLVFDTLELTLSAAEEGFGVAMDDPRMAGQRITTGRLQRPFKELIPNGMAYYLVFPPRRISRTKILRLASILLLLIQEEDGSPHAS